MPAPVSRDRKHQRRDSRRSHKGRVRQRGDVVRISVAEPRTTLRQERRPVVTPPLIRKCMNHIPSTDRVAPVSQHHPLT